jgi:thiol-disulfide isomerase/thioredoxin
VSLLARLGLAVVRPRAALAIAGNREHAGRSGSDLLVALLVVVVVTQARGLIEGVWLGIAVEPQLGIRAVLAALTDALAVDLGFLILGALVIWALSAPRRDLGRASDLACVAVLPLLIVDLVATVVVLALDLEISRVVMTVFSLVAYAWTGMLVTLGVLEARRADHAPPADATRVAKRAGWALVGVTLAGVAVQTVWVARYLDRMRPVMAGDPAPGFALPRIAAKGASGERIALESLRGKIVVLDFWATWCGPCVKAMPRLEAFQRKHANDVVVVAINIDDPAEARAMFDAAGYTAITLVAGDSAVTDRYDVAPIPHTVVIDRSGVVRKIVRGGRIDLEREISGL